jgi:hypothetical protein
VSNNIHTNVLTHIHTDTHTHNKPSPTEYTKEIAGAGATPYIVYPYAVPYTVPYTIPYTFPYTIPYTADCRYRSNPVLFAAYQKNRQPKH